MARLIHKETKQIIAEEILFSHSLKGRIKGLLGYSDLPPRQVMWIKPCSSIHTLFMKFPIDTAFVDKNLCVQSVHKNIAPWKIVNGLGKILHPLHWFFHPSTYNIKNHFKIDSVFEFKAGHCRLKTGDTVYVGS